MKRLRPCFLLLLAALLSSCVSPLGTPRRSADAPVGVPNLALVAPGIYRCGQPTVEGWIYLHSLGVSNVIKLNTVEEGSDAPAVLLGMTVHHYPIPADQQFMPGSVSQADLAAAVREIQPGTVVHCTHGKDRTGLVIGLWRVRQGWTRELAYAEMRQYRFHPILVGLYAAWSSARPPPAVTNSPALSSP
jgi:hypothetical protein